MRKTAVLLLVLLLPGLFLSGQVITGTILGLVVDPSGGSIPGARITITNTGTRAMQKTTANADGEFTVPYLPPGEYAVTVESEGFKTFRKTGIQLTLDSKVRVNAELQVGNVAESIVVQADVQELQADASDLSRSIDSRTLQSMPNVGKSPLAYLNMVAGIVGMEGFDDPDNIGVGDDSRRAASGFLVNGAGVRSSEILLDGAPNTNTAFNEIATLPSTDSIGEMKVITNAYSAEFGRAGGGVISFGTRSGTNQYHGRLYEYWRNPVLNANTFGNNSYGRKPDGTPVRPKSKFNLNQFGGTFEGPVEIPHVYNGRNKTFFFYSYEGIRRVDGASATFTVPTELQRQGDFSQTRVMSRDPQSGLLVAVPVSIYAPFVSTSTVTEVRPGNYRIDRQQLQDGAILNKIPAGLMNPTSRKLINMYPLPNTPPLQPDGTQNYFSSLSSGVRTDQMAVKIDHQTGPTHRTFFRWVTDWTLSDPANIFAGTEPQANNQAPVRQYNPGVTVGHTWTQSTQSLFDFRANWTRINLIQQPSSGLNADLAGLGFSREMLGVVPNMVFPRIELSGFPAMGISTFALRDNHSSNFSVSGSWTRLLRKWTLKFGGEFRPLLSNFNQANIASMAFRNINMTTACTGAGCPAIPFDQPQGYALADLLVGSMDALASPGNGQYTTGDPRMALKNTYMGFYSQNDWKATRRLTVNLGVRWEYQGPTTDRYNRLSQFDLTSLNKTGTPGKYIFSGVNGVERGITDPDYRNWAPRVGFAFRLNDKTVVRSAYGISYNQITGIGSGSNGFGIAGFQFPAFMRVRPVSALDIVERQYTDGFNGGGTMIGANADALLGTNGVVVAQRDWRTPYVQQWNFAIERKLAGMNVALAYVGTKGSRLVMQKWELNSNNAVPEETLKSYREEYIRTGVNPAGQMVPNPFYGTIPAGNTAVAGPTISRINLAKPYPAYGSVFFSNGRFGSSSYNSMQLTANRPMSHGLLVAFAYTWSKSIDFGTGIGGGAGTNSFTIRDLDIQRSVSNNDVPHRATVNYIWELPFGKGKAWLKDTPVLSQLAGGWKLSGLTTWSSGFPIGVAGGGFGRPDIIGDPILPEQYRAFGDGVTPHALPDGTSIVVPKGRYLYFNPHAYLYRTIEVKTATGTRIDGDVYWYGTAPRMDSRLRGPGIDNYNMSVSRTFRVSERARAELRVDANNVFNRTEFSVNSLDKAIGSFNAVASRGPIGYSTSATFGTIDITARPSRAPRNMQIALRINF